MKDAFGTLSVPNASFMADRRHVAALRYELITRNFGLGGRLDGLLVPAVELLGRLRPDRE